MSDIISTEEHEANVRKLYLRFKGDVHAVSRETGTSVKDIRVICKTYKGVIESKTDKTVPEQILKQVMFGQQERLHSLREMHDKLFSMCYGFKSACCGAFIESALVTMGKGTCPKCDADNGVLPYIDTELYRELLRVISSMRMEDASLGKFLSTLGYTIETDANKLSNVFVIQNNLPEDKKPRRIESTVIDAEIVEQAESLSPKDREKLRKDLERTIMEQENRPPTLEQKNQK